MSTTDEVTTTDPHIMNTIMPHVQSHVGEQDEPPIPPSVHIRATEDGRRRITEDGRYRRTE